MSKHRDQRNKPADTSREDARNKAHAEMQADTARIRNDAGWDTDKSRKMPSNSKAHERKQSSKEAGLRKAGFAPASNREKQESHAFTITGNVTRNSAKAVTPRDHAQAGEGHLLAAAAHKALGDTPSKFEKLQGGASKDLVAHHLEKAAEHAAAAGGEWDESKHPRDENGKFG